MRIAGNDMTRRPWRLKLGAAAALAVAVLAWQQPFMANAAAATQAVAQPVVDLPAGSTTNATLVLSGGCFWGVQGVFQHVRGVTSAVSGYAGGAAGTANYDDVSAGATGHAEAVQITYDPRQVSFGKLLQIFFAVAHDPTELNRQGPDTGTQYRSAIFATDAQQHQVAQGYIAQLDASHAFRQPIVTRVEDGKHFYPAEEYHQNYLTLHPNDRYIAINDLPKVASLRRVEPGAYRDDPVLVAVP